MDGKRKKKKRENRACKQRKVWRAEEKVTFPLSPLLSYRILGRPNFTIPLCLGRLPRE